jgi:hypothetical protein
VPENVWVKIRSLAPRNCQNSLAIFIGLSGDMVIFDAYQVSRKTDLGFWFSLI